MDVHPPRREEWVGLIARVEWVVFELKNRKLKLDSTETNEACVYGGGKNLEGCCIGDLCVFLRGWRCCAGRTSVERL